MPIACQSLSPGLLQIALWLVVAAGGTTANCGCARATLVDATSGTMIGNTAQPVIGHWRPTGVVIAFRARFRYSFSMPGRKAV